MNSAFGKIYPANQFGKGATEKPVVYKYFVEIVSLSEVILHAVPKKECVNFWGDHPRAMHIDEKEYLRLKATQK